MSFGLCVHYVFSKTIYYSLIKFYLFFMCLL